MPHRKCEWKPHLTNTFQLELDSRILRRDCWLWIFPAFVWWFKHCKRYYPRKNTTHPPKFIFETQLRAWIERKHSEYDPQPSLVFLQTSQWQNLLYDHERCMHHVKNIYFNFRYIVMTWTWKNYFWTLFCEVVCNKISLIYPIII